jgi:signal transduction histidine kinase
MTDATSASPALERSAAAPHVFSMQEMLDALSIAAFQCDRDGRLVAFNAAARARFRLSASDVGAPSARAVKNGENGVAVPFSVSPLRDADGVDAGTLYVAMDGVRRAETDASVRALLAAIPPTSTASFFDELVAGLCSAFDVDWAMIATLDATAPNVAKTVAWCRRGVAQDPLTYDLRGTPCERVASREICVYPRGLRGLFPNDLALVELGLEAYVGAPLVSSAGESFGILTLMHESPLPNAAFLGSMIGFVAARVSAELERLRASDALMVREQSLRLAQTAGRFGSWEFDGTSRFKVSGDLFDELGLSGSPEGATFKSHLLHVHPHDRALAVRAYKSMRRGVAPEPVELRVFAPDGSTRALRVHCEAVRSSGSGPTRFVGATADVTDRRRFEAAERTYQESLVANARLASMGALAAGVAHEINNPLAYVFSNLDLAAEALRAAEGVDPVLRDETSKCLRHALDGVERVRRIVRGLKSFARGGEERRGAVDLRSVVDAACEIVDNQIRYRARLVKEYADVPRVYGDAARLEQVALNLLVNAAQAIPEGAADAHAITVRVGPTANGGVFLEVRDDGDGMTPETRKRAFEPFFTTKPPGLGTGLGLSICHGIVAAHGGTIAASSAEGVGTTMRVELPPAPARATAADPAPEPAREARDEASPRGPRPSARRRVLIVDDDEMVGDALLRALEKEHEASLCTTARDAPSRIVDSDVDVVLCDLMMPEMTGMQVYDEVKRRAPDRVERIVFMTGGAFTPEARAFLARVSNKRVEKPLRPAQLRALVSNFRAREA